MVRAAPMMRLVSVRGRLLFSGTTIGKIPCADARETAALIAIAELGGRLIAAVPSEACGSFPSFSWNASSPVLVDAITRREPCGQVPLQLNGVPVCRGPDEGRRRAHRLHDRRVRRGWHAQEDDCSREWVAGVEEHAADTHSGQGGRDPAGAKGPSSRGPLQRDPCLTKWSQSRALCNTARGS